MDDDEKHEAFGAMLYRGLAEQRSDNRALALETAMKALERISTSDYPVAIYADMALKRVKEILG